MQIDDLLNSRTINFAAFSDRQFTFGERNVLIGRQIFNAVKGVNSCMIHPLLVLCLPLSLSKALRRNCAHLKSSILLKPLKPRLLSRNLDELIGF